MSTRGLLHGRAHSSGCHRKVRSRRRSDPADAQRRRLVRADVSRQDDIDAVAALIESTLFGDDPWPAVGRWVAAEPRRVTARARLLGLRCCPRRTRAAPRITTLGVAAKPRKPSELSSRPVVNVGGTTVRTTARAGGRDPSSGRNCRATDGTVAGRRVLRLDEQRKLSYVVDFDEPSGLRRLLEAAESSSNRHGPRHCNTGASARRYRTSRRRSVCGSPATAPSANQAAGSPSATTPRCPVAWSTHRQRPASAVTRSPDPLTGLTPRFQAWNR